MGHCERQPDGSWEWIISAEESKRMGMPSAEVLARLSRRTTREQVTDAMLHSIPTNAVFETGLIEQED